MRGDEGNERSVVMFRKPSSDFRTWNMEEETRDGGRDAQGLPYYVWREGADNRLSLSRPRYCCVSEINGELYFEFFDPSKDVRPSWAPFVFMAVIAAVCLARLWDATYGPVPPPRPYHLDESPPPFLNFLGTCFLALSLGGIVSGAWYVVGTLARWLRGRFAGDGRITQVPWRSLQGFNVMNAADTSAGELEKIPRSSYGLGAVFDDGTHVALTANPWNYESIARRHGEMTSMFITTRADVMRRWAEARAAADAGKRGHLPATADQGVPNQL
jgi:hypothetical protein